MYSDIYSPNSWKVVLLIYSLKSYNVNFHAQMSSSQSEEWTMFLTREKNVTSNQNREQSWWYVQSKATEVCKFRAKNPAFYRRLQLAAPSLSRSISDTSTTRA